MNLENVTAELRPRGPWEAADFGVRLIRRDAAAIYRIWFAVTLPVLVLTMLAIALGTNPTLAAFLYWWLEPVADGPILHVVARRLFGEKPNVPAALRAIPTLAWRNRIFLISPYRFHIARSIAMPLTQLEGVKGKARRTRASVLNPRILSYGTGLTIAYQHLVLALYTGIVLTIYLLVPIEYRDTIGAGWIGQFWSADNRFTDILGLAIAYCAQTALQPWFVGAGFGLYINCRTQLEAWDLEVAFRRMVQRRARGLTAAVLIAAICLPMLALPSATWAQGPASNRDEAMVQDPGFPSIWNDGTIRPALEKVMTSDALKTVREIKTWQRIDREQSEPSQDASTGALEDLLGVIGQVVSLVVELGLWILAVMLVWALFVTARRWKPYLRARPRLSLSPHRVILSGGEISADHLPDDIPGQALTLWRDGQRRAALSLLYRGSVFFAVSRHGVRLPPSATEGMCIAAVERQAEAAQATFFRELVTAWSCCAYGSLDPGDELVMRLCTEWPRYYEAKP